MTGDLKRLETIKTFVLDMDGTIYLGDRLFPYTKDFLDRVEKSGREYFFFTNNSSRSRREHVKKLASLGIEVPAHKMLTATDVLLTWLDMEHPGESAFVVGNRSLRKEFWNAGINYESEDPSYVVLGFDTELDYEKLRRACDYVRGGVPLYGINPDLNCPVENGYIPDCGSIAALVMASTRAQCEFFGKPSDYALEFMLQETICRPDEMAVVGDRLYTDIAVAEGTGVASILVLSGETKREMLEESDVQPDIVAEDLGELLLWL